MTMVIVHYLLVIYFVARVLLRPYREPASRIAWMLLLLALPVVGMVIYLLLGETNIGSKRAARMAQVRDSLIEQFKNSHLADRILPQTITDVSTHVLPVIHIARSVNGFVPVPNNHGTLLADSPAAIAQLVTDIEQAQQQVHVLFYIWLTDAVGVRVVDALVHAARRGVKVRVLVDAVGSRALTRSGHWRALRAAGVELAQALSVGNPFLRMLFGRVDLRNHRKIVIIDNRITYCGSQNCADESFAHKAKYAPWVDVMVRLEGPVALQNQLVFVSDWEATTGENLTAMSRLDEVSLYLPQAGFSAQVIATGPTERHAAMSDVFMKMISTARADLRITTPYFVPNESILNALCVAARCGTRVSLCVPMRNDSWIVAAASRSYYRRLLQAGVQIFEYEKGLLHAKLLTIDDEVTLIGSANMDRRSFDLNYENNMVLYDRALTEQIVARQYRYLAHSRVVTLADVETWSQARWLWYNTVATLSPVV